MDLTKVAQIVASWRLGTFTRSASSGLPFGFPTRHGLFIVDTDRPHAPKLLYVHWRPEDEANPLLAEALKRIAPQAGPKLLIRVAGAREFSGAESVVVVASDQVRAVPLTSLWAQAHGLLEGASGTPRHQPLAAPQLTTIDWRRLSVTNTLRTMTSRDSPLPRTDLRRLQQQLLPSLTGPCCRQRDGVWVSSRAAQDFWAGTRVIEVLRNPRQITVRLMIDDETLASDTDKIPLPTDAEFSDVASFFAMAAAGRATLFTSLLWDGARTILEAGIPLTFDGAVVRDVRFCDGVFEHANPVEFHIFRALASSASEAKHSDEDAPDPVEHLVYDGSSHSWLELDMEDGQVIVLESTPAQFPAITHQAVAWSAQMPTATLRRKTCANGDNSEIATDPPLGHRVTHSVSLASKEPVVPEGYWETSNMVIGAGATITGTAATRLDRYDSLRRAGLRKAFMKRLYECMDFGHLAVTGCTKTGP
jgi:hypothetical protein